LDRLREPRQACEPAYCEGSVRIGTNVETGQSIVEDAKRENFQPNLFASRDAAIQRILEMQRSAKERLRVVRRSIDDRCCSEVAGPALPTFEAPPIADIVDGRQRYETDESAITAARRSSNQDQPAHRGAGSSINPVYDHLLADR
jgi:hypothetical protein